MRKRLNRNIDKRQRHSVLPKTIKEIPNHAPKEAVKLPVQIILGNPRRLVHVQDAPCSKRTGKFSIKVIDSLWKQGAFECQYKERRKGERREINRFG